MEVMKVETREQILRRDFSDEFIAKMKNAIEVSHYKYPRIPR